jgi:hypothetical protein
MIRKHNRLSFHYHRQSQVLRSCRRLSMCVYMYVLSPRLMKLVRQPPISLLSRVCRDLELYICIDINMRLLFWLISELGIFYYRFCLSFYLVRQKIIWRQVINENLIIINECACVRIYSLIKISPHVFISIVTVQETSSSCLRYFYVITGCEECRVWIDRQIDAPYFLRFVRSRPFVWVLLSQVIIMMTVVTGTRV